MNRKLLARVGLSTLVLLFAGLVIPNARSLYEGVFFYLRDALTYDPAAVTPVRTSGRYASVHDLVRLTNAGRRDYILEHLNLTHGDLLQISVPSSPQPNLFVRFGPIGPYTVYSAHYDKLHDDTRYQGASDNTAAVSVLLAAITELEKRSYAGPAAFLFTAEEEKGMNGAAAFVEHARANSFQIKEIINFDNLGRGKLAIRPSVPAPGLAFTIPFYGEVTFDGREFRPSPPYLPANARLATELERVQPGIVVYERFTASSDSNVFLANGIDSVAISGDNMYFLDLTWHTYADRVELLDERNLDLAYELIMQRETGDQASR